MSQEFQRRGAGRALMNEVTKRADEQQVPIQIEASPEGEQLYRSVGFELLDRFQIAFGESEKNAGGVMIYWPKNMRKEVAPSETTVVEAEDVKKEVEEEVKGGGQKEHLEIEPVVEEVPVEL